MASISQLTEEERNFIRFNFLNFKVSPDIVRRFFDGVFPPAQLAQTINSGMKKIINLKNTKRINAAQLEILRSVTGTVWPPSLPPIPMGTKPTSSKDFDLTLMICLFRNLGGLSSPSNGWDQIPLPNDTAPGADLATLKWYRNQVAHMAVTSMDNNEFNDKWTQIVKALTSLNKGHRPHEITEILNYDLDGEQAKTLANAELKLLKKEYLECEKEKEQIESVLSVCEKEKEQIESDFSHHKEGNLPKNIADANASLVETWLNDDKSFHDTKASDFVYHKVMKFTCILVTSSSGLGKTATIRHIALQLQQNGFQIVPVESPDDIIKYKTNIEQVFLIDDVLGKYDLNPILLEKWERINEKLISCLGKESSSHKVLSTLRSQIAFNKRFENASTILNRVVIDLEHESIALSKMEKQNILISHLQINNLENEIKTEELMTMCETGYAFPLLCKLVSNNEERFRNRITFFKRPLFLLNKELDKMIHENKKLYCILVLCMFYNGSFPRKIFDVDSDKCDEKIDRITQTCRLPKNMSKKELEDSAVSAIGSYFVMDSNSFRFIHDALEETVGCHFYKFDPDVMFSYCSIMFIRDRVIVLSNENMNENSDGNNVVILENELNEDRLIPLYDRLCKELLSGRFSILLTSNLFKNRNFIHVFVTHFKNIPSILESKKPFWKIVSSERTRSNQSSFVWKWKNKIFYSNKFQDNNDAITRTIEAVAERSTLLHWIVAFGCYEFFQYVWSKMPTLQHNRILDRNSAFNPLVKPFFPLAVLGGSLHIVSQLICTGADVNSFSEFWETPLYIAVRSGDYDMVRLMVKNAAKVYLRGWFTMNIPIMVTSNTPTLIGLILEHDLNQTKLHTAVRNNDLESLRSNLRSENIDSKTKSGWTVLHYAVLLNNLDAVNILLHREVSQSYDSPAQPLLNQSLFDITEVDQREGSGRDPTPKINIGDNNRITALHIAVINNNIQMIRLLLRNKADLKVRDDFDRTPLHYINSERATRLLLSYSPRKQCFKTILNAKGSTAFRSMRLNITLQTSLRNVCRDFVNMPDREGNTPLHCVLTKRILEQERNDCIQTLREYGALTSLFNDSGTLALQLTSKSSDMMEVNPKKRFKNTKSPRMHFHLDTFIYIMRNSATSRQLILNHLVCSVVMFIIWLLTLLLIFFNDFERDVQNSVYCVRQLEEFDSITLVQMTRSLYVTFFALPFLWLLSITKLSVFLWRKLLLVKLLGCVSLLLLGLFTYVPLVFSHMLGLILCSIFCLINLLMSITYNVVRVRSSLVCSALWMFIITVTLSAGIYAVTSKYSLYTTHDLDTLKLTTSNCTDFRSVNITCTTLANNITYNNDVDFNAQCHTDSNIKSYNGTHGTLTLESEVIDSLEKVMDIFVFCLLYWLHAVCTYCLLDSITLVFVKVTKDLLPVFLNMYILGIGFYICLRG